MRVLGKWRVSKTGGELMKSRHKFEGLGNVCVCVCVGGGGGGGGGGWVG